MKQELSLADAGRKRQTVQTARHLAVFQKMGAATGNEQWPAVDRRYCGMCSCSVNDDRKVRFLKTIPGVSPSPEAMTWVRCR